MFPILMVQIGTATKMQRLVLAVVLVCLAFGLRASSFQWNDQLQGDVNLFALTAREFRHSGELRYPIKYEFSDQVPYCEARSVASQHPPLFPFAGGLLARVLDTDAIEKRTPLGRIGEVRDVVGMAVYLAGEEAAFMTGSIITVDGGWTAYGYL